jgi:hypothetical protein
LKKVSLFFLLIISYVSSGQTYISGFINSNTNWTAANSPYIVTGSTVLTAGNSLTIDAGVTVQFDSGKGLDIRGALVVNGNPLDSVYFIPSGTSAWGGIKVSNNYGATINCRYMSVRHSAKLFEVNTIAGTGDTIIKLKNCYFTNVGTVVDEQDDIKSHFVLIDSCIVSDNHAYTSIGASNFLVYNSKFINCYRVFYNSTSQLTIIDNCDFVGATDVALLVVGIVTNSRFYNNHTAIATMNNNYPILHNNDIYSNDVGIELWNYGTSNSASQITNNRICNNIVSVRKIYDADTYLINNCWCSNDSIQIQSTIHDFFYNTAYGIVYFSPFDTTCQNISIGISETESLLKLSIFPNPVNDIFNIELASDTKALVVLYDLANRQIIKQKFTKSISLNFENLKSGIYFYNILFANGFEKKGKIIKN